MDSTILSMTDRTGKTGNVDYKDCRTPSDADLVEAALYYGLSDEVKFTITSVVGNKTKFVANVVDGKLIRLTEEKQNFRELERMVVAIREQELSKILQYRNSSATAAILAELNIEEEEIWDIVRKKREGLWFGIPEKYINAMFNCALAEYITDLAKEYAV